MVRLTLKTTKFNGGLTLKRQFTAVFLGILSQVRGFM
jgi:hypothetical protein